MSLWPLIGSVILVWGSGALFTAGLFGWGKPLDMSTDEGAIRRRQMMSRSSRRWVARSAMAVQILTAALLLGAALWSLTLLFPAYLMDH